MPTARTAPAIEPLLLAYKDAGNVLGIGDQMVAKLVERGLLEGRRLGHKRFVTLASVKKLADVGTAETVAARPERYRTRPAGSYKPDPAAANAARRGRGRPRVRHPVAE